MRCSNEDREQYLVGLFPLIKQQVAEYREKYGGEMPAFIVAEAGEFNGKGFHPGVIVVGEQKAIDQVIETVTEMGYRELEQQIRVRQGKYGENNCLLLVIAGGGIMRTSYSNAELRYELQGKTKFVSDPSMPVGMVGLTQDQPTGFRVDAESVIVDGCHRPK